MKNSRLYDRIFVILTVSALVVATIRADDLYIWARETMGDVTFFYSGSIDNSAFPKAGVNASKGKGSIEPSTGGIMFGAANNNFYNVLPTTGRSFGSGAFIVPSSYEGDYLSLDPIAGTTLYLPENYLGGTPISGSMNFPGETFASLGIDPTPKSFNTTVGTNSIHLFTDPDELAAKAALKLSLENKIKKLQKKAKKLKKKGKKEKAKKLLKKVKKLKKQLTTLG